MRRARCLRISDSTCAIYLSGFIIGTARLRAFSILTQTKFETRGAEKFRGFSLLHMLLNFSKQNDLIPAIVQDVQTGRVLMLAFMNAEAFRATVDTGFATFYSRSRQKLWTKGESSGHRLVIKEISTDCDADAVLLKVEPLGPGVCHEGYQSCFFRRLNDGEWATTEPRTFDPTAVYEGAK